MKNTTFTLFIVAVLAVFAPSKAFAQQPKLVVIVAVDQLCQTYLERFSANFADNGFFKTAYSEGIVYTNAHHQHAFTFTAPGHAAISTGADPHVAGVIANSWYDRELAKKINCVYDPDATTIGGSAEGTSPKNLLADTFGDSLKLATNGKAKVFSIGIKDRAAVLMAGHAADGAFWYDKKTGKWVTSDHYRDDIPGYLRVLDPAAMFGGKEWKLTHPRDRYVNTRPDNYERESPRPDIGRTFPHQMPPADDKTIYEKITITPFGNQFVISSAREIITNEELGLDNIPDVICLGLSATDYIGHGFGPYSLEVEDGVLHTDTQLTGLYEFLGDYMGDRPWVMAITADHGVTPIPEYAATWVNAKRNPLGNLSEFKNGLETHLQETCGEIEGKYILHFEPAQVYFDHSHVWSKPREAVYREAAKWIQSHPEVPLARSIGQLRSGRTLNHFETMLQRAQHHRSGEVLFILHPYHMQSGSPATHGSPYTLDTHVPLILCGPIAQNNKGVYPRPVGVTDLAPTLARMLGQPNLPKATGSVLTEALEGIRP